MLRFASDHLCDACGSAGAERLVISLDAARVLNLPTPGEVRFRPAPAFACTACRPELERINAEAAELAELMHMTKTLSQEANRGHSKR